MAKFTRKKETSEVDQIRMKTAKSLMQNQKLITGVLIGLLVIIGGYFGYKHFIQKPNEEKASNAMFTAEYYFSVDSFNLALNGDGQSDGFLKVINKYGSTNAGNLAHYYAAACFLNMGQAQEAINQLKKFDGKGTDFEAMAAGLLGAAYSEAGDKEKALSAYKKAIEYKNNLTTPVYLRYASIIANELGKTKEAIEFEKRIKKDFPSSNQNRDADKYLALYGNLDVE